VVGFAFFPGVRPSAQVDDGKALDPSSPVGLAGMVVISLAVLPYVVPGQWKIRLKRMILGYPYFRKPPYLSG
jgi:hypothetical protein